MSQEIHIRCVEEYDSIDNLESVWALKWGVMFIMILS